MTIYKIYISCLLLVFLSTISYAQTKTLTITEPAVHRLYFLPDTEILLDENISVSTTDQIEKIYVQIVTGAQTGDELFLDETLATDAANDFDITSIWDDTLKRLTLQGEGGGDRTLSQFLTILRTVGFKSSYTGPDYPLREVKVFILEEDRYFEDPVTGEVSYYQFVSDAGIEWNAAETAAELLTYYGLGGFLAVIETAAENEIVKAINHPEIADADTGWMGGTDADTENTWEWVTGPYKTANVTFSIGSTAQNGLYENWFGSEPNDSGGDEDHLHFYATDGSWNDFNIANPRVTGYLVEFGGFNDNSASILIKQVVQNGIANGQNF